jgi:hypothetical protein
MDISNSKRETHKRLEIVAALYGYMIPACCQGILLTGSLVYGKNTLVHKQSDIDLLCIIDQHHSHTLQHIKFFRGPYLNDHAFELFEAGSVDGLFNDYMIDGIKINIGIWRYAFLLEFCQLQATHLRLYKDALRRTDQAVFTTKKERITLSPVITQTTEGYILDYPLYVQDKLVGLPLLTNLLFCEILQDNRDIQKHLMYFKNLLKQRYTQMELCNLVSYVLEKLSASNYVSSRIFS